MTSDSRNLIYESKDELKLTYDILPVVNKYFLDISNFSTIKNDDLGGICNISFHCKDEIRNESHEFLLHISIEKFKDGSSKIKSTIIELITEGKNINLYDLESYLNSLYYKILLSRNNNATTKYIVRLYSKIYNSHQIVGNYLIKYKYKTLLKPAESVSKQEPNTEHIITFDVELNAVSIEHARTLAYEHVYNLHAFLSILLDVGFEFVDSEYRCFVFHKRHPQGSVFSVKRHRTGYFDPELGLVVRDNLNYLRHLSDKEDMNGFFSGKVGLSLVNEDELNNKNEWIMFDASAKPNLEKVFLERTLGKPSYNSASLREGLQRQRHFSNLEIKFPREIRKYFIGIERLNNEELESFLACSRMYNLALKLHKSEPTAFVSYLICAVESLTQHKKISFSEFLNQYNDGKYDKNLCDYYYAIRSSHFHSGKFHFHETNPSLLTETDIAFASKRTLFNDFYNIIRGVLVKWVEDEVLELKVL